MSARCSDCGTEAETPGGACPNCGSHAWTVSVSDTFLVRLHERIDMKGGLPNVDGKLTKSAVRDLVRAGSVPSKLTASGRADIYRRIDRDGRDHGGVPWYEEKVVDPDTGDVLIDKSHPLDQKPPSGSAKPK